MLGDDVEAETHLKTDLEALFSLVRKPAVTPEDFKTFPSILRRVLDVGEGYSLLEAVAHSLGEPITIRSPDRSVDLAGQYPYGFYFSLGATFNQVYCGRLNSGRVPNTILVGGNRDDGWNPISRRRFLDEPVICISGEWLSRYDAISFVANKAGAVHLDRKRQGKQQHFRALDVARNVSSLKAGRQDGEAPGNIHLTMTNDIGAWSAEVHFRGILDVDDRFKFRAGRIDLVQFECFSAAYYLVNSPDVQRLLGMLQQHYG